MPKKDQPLDAQKCIASKITQDRYKANNVQKDQNIVERLKPNQRLEKIMSIRSNVVSEIGFQLQNFKPNFTNKKKHL